MKRSKVLIVIIAMCMLIAIGGSVYAGGIESESTSMVKWVKDRTKITASLSEEYDDNIYLHESSNYHDWKTTVTPQINFLHSFDKGYFNVGYVADATYYARISKLHTSQGVTARWSYDFTPAISLGLSDSFVYSREITSKFLEYDRFIRVGYYFNQLTPNAVIKLNNQDRLKFSYSYIYTDFFNSVVDDAIDKTENMFVGTAEHDFNHILTGFLGYQVRSIDLLEQEFETKDFNQHDGYVGMNLRIPVVAKVVAKIGIQKRDYRHGKTNDSNVAASVNVMSTFSRKMSINGFVDYGVGDSTRRDYRQHNGLSFGYNSSWRFGDGWTLYGGNSVQVRKYNKKDIIDPRRIFFDNPISKSYTSLQGIRKTINDTFYADLFHVMTKQDTDFAREGYTNNRYQIKITGNW